MDTSVGMKRTRAAALSAIAVLWLSACGGGGGGAAAPSAGSNALGQGASAPAPEPETTPTNVVPPAPAPGPAAPAPAPAPQPPAPAPAPNDPPAPPPPAPAPPAPTPAPPAPVPAPPAPTPAPPAPTPAPPAPVPAPPAPAPAPAPAPTPPAPAPSPASQQAVRNGTYIVTANGAQPVVITLPANADLQVGDRVTVTGQGTAPWRLGQNAQQYVVTTNVPGNTIPGNYGNWVPREPDAAMPAQNWSSTATTSSGNRIAAASANGIYISADGGVTWSRSNAPAGGWVKLAMNSDGSRMVAALAGGAIYTSSDFGATWSASASGTRPWTSVYVSENGQKIVGSVSDAGLFMSNDGGATFALVPGTESTDWRAVAGSADGNRLLATASKFGAVAANAGVYVSTDGGATWTRRATTGPDTPFDNFVFAACSSTCMRMAVLDNGGFPYVSEDGGTTFNQRFGFSNWSGLAVSGDGTRVAALEPRNDTYNHTGYVFLGDGSGDWPFLGENRWYSSVSLSNDGNWVVVTDRGPDGSGGRLYTSQGNRTSGGTLGFIGGGQNQGVEVTYQGNGRFTVTTTGSGAFTIR